jgi:hypothetical protein
MIRIRGILLDNIRNIARLEHFPTHQLRVVNPSSCLPEILHESRTLSSVMRLVSGDSRKGVLTAIEQTLLFISEGLQYSVEFQRDIARYEDTFERGLTALKTHYERDMYVTMVIDRILHSWRNIIHSLQMEEDVACPTE